MNKAHEELAAKLDSASREKNTLDARLSATEDAIHVLEEELTRIAGLYESKEVVLNSYRELINGYDRETETVQGAISTAEERCAVLQTQIDALEEKATALQEQLTSLQGLSSDDQERMETLKQNSSAFEMDKMSLFKEIEGIRTLIGQLENQLTLRLRKKMFRLLPPGNGSRSRIPLLKKWTDRRKNYVAFRRKGKNALSV